MSSQEIWMDRLTGWFLYTAQNLSVHRVYLHNVLDIINTQSLLPYQLFTFHRVRRNPFRDHLKSGKKFCGYLAFSLIWMFSIFPDSTYNINKSQITKGYLRSTLIYLPWNSLNLEYPLLFTSSDGILQLSSLINIGSSI